MNRRDFTRGLAAFGLAPLVPAPSLALASSSVAAPAASSGSALMFINSWSAHYVRKTGSCTPDQLAKHFGLLPETAKRVTHHLVEKGVLTAPNSLGVCKAINPLQPTTAKATSTSLRKAFQQEINEAEAAPALEPREGEDPSQAPSEEISPHPAPSEAEALKAELPKQEKSAADS